MTPVAAAAGSNRIVRGHAIVYPLGDAELPESEERELRRQVVQRALEALKSAGTASP